MKIESGWLGATWTTTMSWTALRARRSTPSSVLGKRLRSIPMTGVMPEPAVTMRNLPPAGGRTNSPAACSRWTSVPGRAAVDEVVADQAVGDGLDGDRDAAVAARAVGERVRAPLAYAVDVDADAEVLAGHVAGPVGAGADHDGRGVGGLGVHGLDAAAEVGARAERGEEVHEVGREVRRGGGLGDADQLVAQSPAPAGAARGRLESRGHRYNSARIGPFVTCPAHVNPGVDSCSLRTKPTSGVPMVTRTVRPTTQIQTVVGLDPVGRRRPALAAWPRSPTARSSRSSRRCPAMPARGAGGWAR